MESEMQAIFVFGSNTEGYHGGGAARYAADKCGAIYGVPMGLQDNSYAIITKDLRKGERSVSLQFIKKQIDVLFIFAISRRDLFFKVTRIGCGLAGFKEEEIAPLFKGYEDIANIELCPEFLKIFNK